jgi:hypothetical protein
MYRPTSNNPASIHGEGKLTFRRHARQQNGQEQRAGSLNLNGKCVPFLTILDGNVSALNSKCILCHWLFNRFSNETLSRKY